MVSLGSIRFSDVMACDGGPIAAVHAGELNVFGRPFRHANAFLRPEISENGVFPMLFGQADGSGTDADPTVACHMAVSHALERWAYLAARDSSANAFGFDVDASSNGMAAFPGLFRRTAQNLAELEAIERHSVIAWWDGCLPAEQGRSPFPGVDLIRIHHDAGDAEVVILVQRTRAGQAYGRAAGRTLRDAIAHAAVQLARAEFLLTTHRAKGALVTPAGFLERRALFFAGPEGAELFERRLGTAPHRSAPTWRPAFNGEIPGPWSRWATVWRCAVEMPTDDYLDPSADFFFW